MTFRSLLPMMLVATSLSAQGAGKGAPYSWLQLQGGALIQSNAPCVEDGTLVAFSTGQWLGSTWGWELGALTGTLRATDHTWKARETDLNVSALLSPFGPMGAWRPFLRGSLGLTHLEPPLSLSPSTAQRINLMVGVGTQLTFGARGFASAELRFVSVQTREYRTEIQALVGVGFRWGQTQPAQATLPAVVQMAAPTRPAATLAPAPPPAPVAVSAITVPVPIPPPGPLAAAAPAVAPKAAQTASSAPLTEAVLHFANDGAQPGKEAWSLLVQVAQGLQRAPEGTTLRISGHTSSTGARTYNLSLSRRRAEAVRELLLKAGVPESRIRVDWFGPDQPCADNATRLGQAKNRRAEVEVGPQAGKAPKLKVEGPLVQGSIARKPRSPLGKNP
ncbi:MAG: OmpA family protein [Holophagaceae bacterium]|nr:OmpA family protein [Holophagaceae bacterium]